MLDKTQYLLIIFIGVSAGLLGGIMQLPFWTIGVTIFAGTLGIVTLPLVWAVYLTKNTKTVERYLQNRKKHPYIDFYYQLAQKDEAALKAALDTVKKKYTSPHI